MCGSFLTTMPRLPVTNFAGGSQTPGELTGPGEAHVGVILRDFEKVRGAQAVRLRTWRLTVP